jgi:uncharacterized protein (DUF433 family)
MQIEIPDELAAAVAEIAEKTGQDVQSLVVEMVTEAIKMRRVPGILFADGATGRRARVGGTGIEVFEIIDRYESVGRDRVRLQELFDWLKPHQLNDAIAYYEEYPDDIRPYLLTEEEEIAAMEALWAEYPHTRLDWPGRLRSVVESAGDAARESA